MQKRTALLSVYNKQGIVKFANELIALGFDILASGGTAKTLAAAGVRVLDVAELVGRPILQHRVVTLSREVHAGLLATKSDADIAELEALSIPYIDLVCVDLYPLEAEIATTGATTDSVIEKTDIGGPTMIRSAAKGRRVVIADSPGRDFVLEWLKAGEPAPAEFRNILAADAERIVANYCLASARYHSKEAHQGFIGTKVDSDCPYGENGWQKPVALYTTGTDDPLALDKFELVQGQEPSYNNYCDLDRLLQTMTHIAAAFQVHVGLVPKIAVAVKHGNPCGAAIHGTEAEALKNMVIGDKRAIFGGMAMTNFHLTAELAEILLTYGEPSGKRLLDGVIAPGITEEAVRMLERKKDKCRLLVNPALEDLNVDSLDTARRFRYVRGGFLSQPNYSYVMNLKDENVQTFGLLSPFCPANLLLAWAIGSTSTSNTVTLVNGGHLIGNGVGQQDRVGACELAIRRAEDAGHAIGGASAYSDSFFPFPDGPEALAKAGVGSILASSGSVNDQLIKDVCGKNGVALVLVPDKLGRGFYGH